MNNQCQNNAKFWKNENIVEEGKRFRFTVTARREKA